ncbi:hypothetical protein BH24CHL10_BH24CHL10_06890 [soil metagenome]
MRADIDGYRDARDLPAVDATSHLSPYLRVGAISVRACWRAVMNAAERVGTDAAPYFRIFNPTLQAKKFDPEGAYVRRWVPELAHLPSTLIHEPWRSPDAPADYPSPILDHADARARTLGRYRAGAYR